MCRALYFSRSPIPYQWKEQENHYYGHIGIYAFRMKVLEKFVTLDQSRLEIAEKLEQLRLLENNITIHIVMTDYHSCGVDRPEDIECLARHFLQADTLEIGPKSISAEALNILSEYTWPGNLRELKSVINKAAILAESDIIMPLDLPSHLAVNKEVRRRWSRTLKDIEKEHIINVLEETGGNQSKASEILGINRKTLYKKIHKYKIFS